MSHKEIAIEVRNRFFENAKKPFNERPLQKHLWLVLTRLCNLSCKYCYQGEHLWTWQNDKGLTKFIDEETLDATLEWVSEWCSGGLQATCYGGEPLLNFEMMKKFIPKWQARFHELEKGLSLSVTTNGMKLTKEVRDFIYEHILGLMVSLDGPPRIQNKQRPRIDGRETWDEINPGELLKWKKDLVIAWQLDPGTDFKPEDLDWMLDFGFKNINFNIQWLVPWSPEAQLRLMNFMKHVARLSYQGKFRTNMIGKLESSLTKERPEKPCGTGDNLMLALSPEGWLYPSQEMVFSAVEPNRATDTDIYYRVGNVFNDPVIYEDRVKAVSNIRNDQMKVPEGFDCDDCVAKPISFGGCHCRYIGQVPSGHPEYRFDVLEGWCQSLRAMVLGLMDGAAIEKRVGMKPKGDLVQIRGHQGREPAPPNGAPSTPPGGSRPSGRKPIDVGDVYQAIQRLEKRIDEMTET